MVFTKILKNWFVKHSEARFNRPIAGHTYDAFQSAAKYVAVDGRPIILDSGCGVGESTINLAQQHRDCLVIGIDQSEHRLQKNPYYNGEGGLADNILLLRADCVDFWRLALEADWLLQKHYLLYPNPWPKKSHIKRRWHGHPVLPSLLQLGGELELRSNWQIYIDEFAKALEILGYEPQVQKPFVVENYFNAL